MNNSVPTSTTQDEPVDKDLAATLLRFAQLDASTITPGMNYVQRRRYLSELQAQLIRQPVADVIQQMYFVPAVGREIPVRSYRTKGLPIKEDRAPLVWLHGGGWMVGDLNTHDDLCERLAKLTARTVVSVHYRRTPENPYPAPLDDVIEVLKWMHQMQGHLPWAHPQAVLGGDSAGAHLALAAAVRQLDSPIDNSAAISGLLLLYPPLLPQQSTASMRTFANGYGLTPQAMQCYWQALVTPTTQSPGWHYPSLCEALIAHLPPTVLMTASHDILRDEGEDFALRAQALGAPLQLLRAPGMIHGFARMLASSSQAAAQVASAWNKLEPNLLPLAF